MRVERIPDANGDSVGDLVVAEHFYDQKRNIFEVEHVFSGVDGSTISVQPDADGRLVKLAADVDEDTAVGPTDATIVSQQVGTTVGDNEPNPADVNADGQVAADDVIVVLDAQGQSIGGTEPAPILPRLTVAPVTGLDPPPAFGIIGSTDGPGDTDGGDWLPPDDVDGDGDDDDSDDGDGDDGDDEADDEPDDWPDDDDDDDCATRVSFGPRPEWVPFPDYPDDTIHMTFFASGSPSGGTYRWWVSGASYEASGARCEVTIKRPGRVIVRVRYTAGGCTDGDRHDFIAFKADLDVDSDNDDGFEISDGLRSEEEIEDDPAAGPGKVLFTSVYDSDGDGVPDLADGREFPPGTWPVGWPDAVLAPGDVDFVPVRALVGGLPSGTEYTVRFLYDASDPMEVTHTPGGTGGSTGVGMFELPEGRLRLWTRPGDEPRNPMDVAEGGDFIVPGVEYTAEELGTHGSSGKATLYLEAVAPSVAAAASAIRMELTVYDGPEPIPVSLLSDQVRVTAAEVYVYDLRHWGPAMDTPWDPNGSSPTVQNWDFDSGAPEWRVGGAVTDGASICLVRVVPPLGEAVEPMRVEMFHSEYDFYREMPEVFGGFTDGTDVLPPLPIVTSPGQYLACERELVDGKTFYVPPESYIDPTRTTGYSVYLNGLEYCDLGVEAWINGYAMGKTPFKLRRPPIVLVHGLQSSPATWHPQAWNEASGIPIPTRQYRVDYSGSNLKGYAENFGRLGLMIREALEQYRTALDAGHPPARSFRGIKYAATRVDVIGHSMGGQIARLYASNLTGFPIRGGNWLSMPIGPRDDEDNEHGKWSYLRNNNWGAGDIRRLVTIGSPFRGSPIADAVVDELEYPNSEPAWLAHDFIGQNEWLLPNDVHERVYPGGAYDPPTAIADLTTTSRISTLLSNNALYPTGHKAVAWAPFVGLATNDDAPLETGTWELLFTFVPVLQGSLTEIEPLNPTTSDLVVPEASQRNNLTSIPALPFEFHIHAGPVMVSPVPETASIEMSDKAGRLLSGPRTGLLTGGLGQ